MRELHRVTGVRGRPPDRPPPTGPPASPAVEFRVAPTPLLAYALSLLERPPRAPRAPARRPRRVRRRNLSLPNEGQPSEIAVVRGNRQSGTTGEPLGDSLVVRVVDRLGDPVIGAEVTWTAEVGGSVSPATSVTSSTGQAGTQRMLGHRARDLRHHRRAAGHRERARAGGVPRERRGRAARAGRGAAGGRGGRRAPESAARAPAPGRGRQRRRPRGRRRHRADLERRRHAGRYHDRHQRRQPVW